MPVISDSTSAMTGLGVGLFRRSTAPEITRFNIESGAC